ncbi:MAG: DUF503 domain-containing protein [Deltaproteobacteria bacterium]|nr:DUF503 domain-containing protein [Deltaproteobacteria bacterium]
MVVGVLELTLTFYAESLKDKRSVVKRVIHRAQEKFNVAAAEVDENDTLNTAVLGFVTVGNDARFIGSVLDKVVNFVERLEIAEIVDQSSRVDHW